MQTFLPYPSFHRTAKCLDNRRLGKQRVECKQILNALEKKSGWSNHPAVLMWRGHEDCLRIYAMVVCNEWISRGYVDNLFDFFYEGSSVSASAPSWLGMRKFHASHRSNLLRKDPVWYGQFGWKESDDLEYVWPTKLKRN